MINIIFDGETYVLNVIDKYVDHPVINYKNFRKCIFI